MMMGEYIYGFSAFASFSTLAGWFSSHVGCARAAAMEAVRAWAGCIARSGCALPALPAVRMQAVLQSNAAHPECLAVQTSKERRRRSCSLASGARHTSQPKRQIRPASSLPLCVGALSRWPGACGRRCALCTYTSHRKAE